MYGNFGWQQSDNRLGAAGLSCFDKDGHKIWDYRPPEGFEFISDCYALNVSKVGPWAHYYTDFPIVSVDSHWQIRAWQSDLGGARNLAVGDRMALLYGGYGDRRTACGLLEFGDREATWIAEVSLALPEHVDRSKALVIGRDRELHLFSGDDWYVFSVDSLDLSHS